MGMTRENVALAIDRLAKAKRSGRSALLSSVWDDPQLTKEETITRCWRKANCLGAVDQAQLQLEAGSASTAMVPLESNALGELCQAMNDKAHYSC